jgi:hypothetical protein
MMDKIFLAIIGAVIAWAVPKILDRLLAKAKEEGKGLKPLEESFPWVRWCVALTIGGGVGGFISAALGVGRLHTPGGFANWTAFGVAIGISEWLVLRRYVDMGPFWSVFCALGWSVWSFFEAAKMPAHLGWSAVGISVGVLQWFILRRVRAKAIWWVPANLVGWLVAGTLGTAFGFVLLGGGVPLPIAWVLGWAFVGLVGAVILGFALRRMPAK